MKKVFQLIFGDARNVVSVTASVALSWAAAQWLPAASGWVLAAALLAAAFWQAV